MTGETAKLFGSDEDIVVHVERTFAFFRPLATVKEWPRKHVCVLRDLTITYRHSNDSRRLLTVLQLYFLSEVGAPWPLDLAAAMTVPVTADPHYYKRLLQLLLFFHAAYTAVLLMCYFARERGSQYVWWVNGYWSYPLTIIPLFASFLVWTWVRRRRAFHS